MTGRVTAAALVYLVMINAAAFAAMGADKSKARRRTLFLLSLLGGSVGSLAGMYTFRHKTRHLKFVLGMPLILILHLAAAGVLLYMNIIKI